MKKVLIIIAISIFTNSLWAQGFENFVWGTKISDIISVWYKLETVEQLTPYGTTPLMYDSLDGEYRIIISVTDSGAHESNAVMPIYIGNLASGDVDADGDVDIIDVNIALQIFTKEIIPTASQIQGADMNNDGKVTMLDVVNLFEQVKQ